MQVHDTNDLKEHWKKQELCCPIMYVGNIARVRNCPDVAILNSLFVFLSFVFFSFFFVFLSSCLDITLIKYLNGLKSQKSLVVSKF